MITSKSNSFVKEVKSLHQKKIREEKRLYFVEGIKMVKEAIAEKMPIEKIILCEELLKEPIPTQGCAVELVNQPVFEALSDTQTPQGVMAIIRMPQEKKCDENIIFALDTLQDPGNLGTIIRTLDCAGIHSLLLSEGTVDVYNPKVLRGTMGAIYRVNCIEHVNLPEKLQALKQEGYQIVITDLTATQMHYELDFHQKLVIVIGNEANGVSEAVKKIADCKVKIPMLGRTESLNAGVAASLMAYENVRQTINNLHNS